MEQQFEQICTEKRHSDLYFDAWADEILDEMDIECYVPFIEAKVEKPSSTITIRFEEQP